ncbi:MAG: GNAT family N-acetyltransferase [Oscillospiraceae bacterium]|nr:GNAT family N-acetyltransferase [Oscillospiraceae bacterium]
MCREVGLETKLKKLWRACFPYDPPAFIDAFFERLYPLAQCFCERADGRVVSVLYGIPAALDGQKLLYIYAAGTHPDYRGRGLMGALLRRAHETARAEGYAAAFLKPGEDGLFDYYARFGYHPCFAQRTVNLEALRVAAPGKKVDRTAMGQGRTPAAENTDGTSAMHTIARIPAADYPAARRRMLPPMSVEWPDTAALFAAHTAEMAGGMALASAQGMALCEPMRNKVRVWELLCMPEERAVYLAAIKAAFPNVNELEVTEVTGEERFGMVCPLREGWTPPTRAYMGLTLG